MRGKPFTKGHGATKPKGAVAKTTKQTKEIIVAIVNDQVDSIAETMESIKAENKIEYMKLVIKLLDYVVPKKIDATSNGETIKAFTWTINDSPTKDK
jgi:hypothetical protein